MKEEDIEEEKCSHRNKVKVKPMETEAVDIGICIIVKNAVIIETCEDCGESHSFFVTNGIVWK